LAIIERIVFFVKKTMLYTINYLAISEDGDCIDDQTLNLDLKISFPQDKTLDNQSLFEALYNWGLDHEEIITNKVKETLGELPNTNENHCHYYILGVEDSMVNTEDDFFDYGDNSSSYFNL